MELDYKAAGFYLDVLQWLSIGLVATWGYLRTKDTDNARAVKSVADELSAFIKASTDANNDQNNRLTVLEEAVKHLPKDEEVQQIAKDVSSMKSRLEGQSQLLQRVEHQTSLIQGHLLNKQR